MGGSSSSSRNVSDLKYPDDYSDEDSDQKSLILDRIGNLSRSFGTFHQFLDLILDVSTRVSDFFVENKDREFESLMDLYFESSSGSIQLCNSLVSRFRLAKTNRFTFENVKKMMIEEEDRRSRIKTSNAKRKNTEDGMKGETQTNKKERLKTLVEELKRLNASISGVFDEDFVKLMVSVHELKANLSKELLKHTNGFNGFSSEPNQISLILSLKSFVEVSIVEKIREVVERLETLIEFGETRFRNEEESDEFLLGGNVDLIMEDMDEFTLGIEKLGQHAEKCYKEIMVQRTRVRNHMLDIFLTE